MIRLIAFLWLLVLAAPAVAQPTLADLLREVADRVEQQDRYIMQLEGRLAAIQAWGDVRLRTAVAGRAVHFIVPDLDEADVHLRDYAWDFGDGSAVRHGFNAAHVYAEPGDYAVSLNDEVFAHVTVVADARPVRPVASVQELSAVLTAGGIAQLPAGPMRVTRTLTARPGAAILGDPEGSTLLGAEGIRTIVDATAGGVLVRGVTFDSDHTATGKGAPDAVKLGDDVTLIDCNVFNIGTFAGLPNGGTARRVLVQGCASPLETGLKEYFVGLFGRAEDVAVYDSSVANSTTEHCIRASGEPGANGGTFRIAIEGNTLTNLDRRGLPGAGYDIAKGTIVMQKGGWGYAAGNTLTGASGAGPLGGRDGRSDAASRWRYAVWTGNTTAGHWQADHGLEHCRYEGNTVDAAGETAIEVKGRDSDYDRTVIDLLLKGNTLRTEFAAGRLLVVWPCEALRLEGNRLVYGDERHPHGSFPPLDFKSGWSEEYASAGNVIELPPSGWPGGRSHAALVGNQNDPPNWLTPAQWNALDGVDGDRFE